MLYNEDLAKVYLFSKQEAERLNFHQVYPEHLFLGILRLNSGHAMEILQTIDLARFRQQLNSKLETIVDIQQQDDDPVLFSDDADSIKRISELEARRCKSKAVDTEHLLLALLRKQPDTEEYMQELKNNGITYNVVLKKLQQANKPRMGTPCPDEEDEENENNGKVFNSEEAKRFIMSHLLDKQQGDNKDGGGQSDTPALNSFGTDITKAAAENRLDPVVGRDKEIERIVQILCRRKKNNPVLIGDPGVGKSAIVDGLAQRIVSRRVSHVLYGKRIISIDLAGMVAGTKYRGQFEERIKAVVNELSNHPEVILFIDEIHTIVGAGSAAGTLDAANMLKPALANGSVQCIGATTLDEYRNSIEKDGALERRFQKVLVEPTSAEDTLQILHNVSDRYEYHHNVKYTPEALEACVRLTNRYISDRCFPDKAIDALDEAGARMHSMAVGVPENIKQLEKEIDDTCTKKAEIISQQQYELAVELRDKERTLRTQLDAEMKQWENEIQQHPAIVDADQVANVVSLMSGVPVQRIAQSEGTRLRNMRTELTARVIGQDAAVDALVKSIQRNRLGLKDPNKPIGSFLFLGPTGVGKTHLAKSLAESMFGSTDAIIRVDMSEFMEKFSVSRLIGAPPGYVGYEEGGQLTEKVRRKPYSIVLLDEIEKAHTDVFNLLLQVMDEGRLTDSLGRRIDFKNTIIIMTSNVGTRQLKEFGHGIGFQTEIDNNTMDSEYARGVIKKALNKTFSPEFLNRVDDVITFDQLNREAIHKIIDLELKELIKRVEEMGYQLQLTQAAKDFIADKGYDAQYGARPLKRAIQHYVEDPMADLLLDEKPANQGTVFMVDLQDGKTVITPQTAKRKTAKKA